MWNILDELLRNEKITQDFYEALPLVLYNKVMRPKSSDIDDLDDLFVGELSRYESEFGIFSADELSSVEGRFLHRGRR